LTDPAISSIMLADPLITGSSVIFILIGILISVMTVAIAHMIATVFDYPEMKSRAVTEMGEVLRTIFIIILLAFSVVFLNTLIMAALGLPPSADPWNAFYMSYAHAYIMSLKQYFFSFMINIFTIYFYFMQISSYRYVLFSLRILPFAAFKFINEYLTKYIFVGLSGWVLMEFQDKLLMFFRSFSWKYIIPLGVVFRAFPLTRKTGSTLIAFAACGLFVFPLLLILNSLMLESYVWGEAVPAIPVPDYERVLSDANLQKVSSFTPLEIDSVCSVEEMLEDISPSDDAEKQDPEPTKNFFGIGKTDPAETTNFYSVEKQIDKDIEQGGTGMNAMTKLFKQIGRSFVFVPELYKFAVFVLTNILKVGLRNAMDAYFTSIIVSLTIYSEKLALTLFLLVLDIVIFLTALKDISLAIGGEAELIGFQRVKKMYIAA